MATAAQPQTLAREFFALAESNLPMELIDGEVIVSPAPKDPHQKASLHLLQVLLSCLPDGEIRYSPADVYLDEMNVVQPDIFWVSESNTICRLNQDGYWQGAPDLVIEILSPGTARQDKVVKFRLYEQHGVKEYWLVDPAGKRVEVWFLIEKRYEYQGSFGPSESFHSTVLGNKKIDLSAVFKA
jgi:Uma2 family endonuclease